MNIQHRAVALWIAFPFMVIAIVIAHIAIVFSAVCLKSGTTTWE